MLSYFSSEIVTAYLAGAIIYPSALKVAYYRGLLTVDEDIRKGAMLAVSLYEARTKSYINRLPLGYVAVVCLNSLNSYTISGNKAAVKETEAALKTDVVLTKRLTIDVTYYLRYVVKASAIYIIRLKDLEDTRTNPLVLFYSSIIGREKTYRFRASY